MRMALTRYVERDARPFLDALLMDEPAVLLEGPRGSGKSTLIREIADTRSAKVIDLDDDAVLSIIREDPFTALQSEGLVVIDEFQRAPSVLSVVKRVVDRDGRAGRFLLAGSVGARLLPTGSETLTGRVHRLHLPPLAVGEVLQGPGRLLPLLLTSQPPTVVSSLSRADYFDLIVAGGYPAALRRATPNLRSRWFASYLSSVAERDLPQLSDVRHPGALARLYRLVAQQTSGIVSRSAVAEQLAMGRTAASAYLDLLHHVYLITELPGWTIGVSAKEGRRPKVHVTDTGLAAAAIGMDAGRLASGGMAGAFMESFVLAEISKQLSTVGEPLTLAHFRDRSGVEVDLVVERSGGQVIGIEVKSATSVNEADARGLKFLRDRLGDRFLAGVVLYSGSLTGRLSDRIWASPVSALWGGDPRVGE